MNYQKNLKYFKSNDKHFYIGVGVLALGVICFVLPYIGFYFLPYHEITSAMIAVIGAIVAFVPRSMRSNENDIDEIVAQKTKGYETETAENAGVEDMLSHRIKSVTVGDYVFEGENVILRKGKDDRKYRSTLYTASALVFTNAGIYVAQKTFSFINDTEYETDAQFLYEDLDSVTVAEEEIPFADGIKVKKDFLVFSENGKEVLRIPTNRGSAMEMLCDDINYQIAEAKKER